ncbi:MoeA domain protein domain I and II [Thermodesulfobium narugense DSM 14796]|uniref:Molybdopterin molybdenumtransferase n=1 Tax=Thermodesulfobium narugense DSM 14796 TaxID=747365 RepID=M1E979_9BACT|nr:molybdopterin molybdotransferase MoeA [Thermodesulfobium narugense]AEE15410.1 MoeA domain protein domain I and II [Thermodesulfobium narugense DSM 14796]
MVDVEKAKILILQNASLLGTEYVSLKDSIGRILAEDIKVEEDVPARNLSAMDGFAIKLPCDDKCKIIGESRTERPFLGEISQNEAVKVSTGSVLPKGSNAVVLIEDTLVSSDVVYIKKMPLEGRNIFKMGEEYEAGSIVSYNGSKISPFDFATFCRLNKTKVKVFKKVKISLLAVGKELVSCEEEGLYKNFLTPTFEEILRRPHIEIKRNIICRNNYEIEGELKKALDDSDIIISFGNASFDSSDGLFPVVQKIFEPIFWRVKMQPGKSLMAFKKNKTYYFGLSGNVWAAVLGFYLFIRPLIFLLSGQDYKFKSFESVLGEAFNKNSKEARFLRGTLIDNKFYFKKFSQHSHSLKGFRDMTHIAMLNPGPPQDIGAKVRVFEFSLEV